MAAIILLREWFENNTATAVDKTGGTIRFKNLGSTLASTAVDYNNPLTRPAVGTNYSYEKYLRLKMGGTGPVGSVTAPVVYTDGSNGLGTGIGLTCGVAAAWSAPINTVSVTATTNFFTKTAGSPLAMEVTPGGSWTNAAINTDIADYLVLQASVASTASPGLTASELLTIQWQET